MAVHLPRRRQPNHTTVRQGVFSYYNNRPSGQGSNRPPDGRDHWWKHTWVRNLPSLVALGIITVCVLYCLSLSTNPKVVVSTSSPQGVVLRDKATYQAGAQEILNRSPLSHTKFTINSGGFEKAFQEKFPEVADVSIALPIVSRRPIVTISTAQPQLILTANNQAYVLDKRGTVIMEAKDLSSSVRQSLPVANDQSGLSVAVGKTVLPADDIQFITSVLAQLKAAHVDVANITLPAIAHEVDIRFNGQPYFAKFSIDTDAREAAGTFLATKQKLEQTNQVPAQYIDVRVPGRAYYQ